MKKSVYFLLLIFLLTTFSFSGETAPGTRLFQISTKYFDILYSDYSRYEAQRLAGFADSYYERVQGLLQRASTDRITVLLSDDYQGANGYSLPLPQNHIVLYVYPSENDSVIAHNPDYLQALFIHELAHAVSLTIRGPLMEFAYHLFGSWVLPQMYMIPGFMVEGVTVSVESLDGFGRGNLNIVKDELRQDQAEGRFKSLSQASGGFDLYPGGRIIYHYGGYFNRFLIGKYGLDKYRELWHRTGGGNPFLMLPGSFRLTYTNSLRQEWQDFRKTMILDFPLLTNTNIILKPYLSVDSIVSDGRLLYYQDGFRQAIYSYDTATHKEKLVVKTDAYIDRLVLHPDGRRLLVSRSSLLRGKPRLLVQVFDLRRHHWEKVQWTGVREAGFYRDGIVAVQPRGFLTDLVFLSPEGVKVLLQGEPEMYFGSPSSRQDGSILFSLRLHGLKYIARFNPDNNSVEIMTQPESPNTPLLPQIRDISVHSNQICFSWHDGRGLSQGAYIEGDILYQYTNQILGGIHLPLITSDRLYYLGQFSRGDKLMQLPSGIHPLTSRVQWQELNLTNQAPLPPVTHLTEKPYKTLAFLKPQLWAPWPHLYGTSLQGIGLVTYLADPSRNNIIMPYLDYSLLAPFVNLDITWQNTATELPWMISFKDELFKPDLSAYKFRSTSISLDIGHTWYFLPVNHFLHLGFSLIHDAFSFISIDSPQVYATPYSFLTTQWGIWARISSYTGLYPFPRARGIQFSLYLDHPFQGDKWKIEADTFFSPQALPLFVTMHAAWVLNSSLSLSGSDFDFYYHYKPLLSEYALRPDSGTLYLYANARMNLFSLEIQRGLGALPFYIQRLYSLAGYRAASLLQDYYHSLYVSMSLNMVLFQYIGLRVAGEVYYAINDNRWGYHWGISYDAGYLFQDDKIPQRISPLQKQVGEYFSDRQF